MANDCPASSETLTSHHPKACLSLSLPPPPPPLPRLSHRHWPLLRQKLARLRPPHRQPPRQRWRRQWWRPCERSERRGGGGGKWQARSDHGDEHTQSGLIRAILRLFPPDQQQNHRKYRIFVFDSSAQNKKLDRPLVVSLLHMSVISFEQAVAYLGRRHVECVRVTNWFVLGVQLVWVSERHRNENIHEKIRETNSRKWKYRKI